MLKTKILNNTYSKLNNKPVRFNLDTATNEYATGNNQNDNSQAEKAATLNRRGNILTTINSGNDEACLENTKAKDKCEEWLEKHVMPYLTLANNSPPTPLSTSTTSNGQTFFPSSSSSNDIVK